MAFPYLDNPATLSDTTVQELDGLVTKLNTFLRQQHTDNGTHTTITATSVIVDGPVTVRDEQQTPSTFARTTATGTVIDITGRPDNTNPFLSIRYKFGIEPLGPVVRLGTVGTGSTGVWPGMRVGPSPAAGHTEWDMVSGQVTAGPAWMLVDATHGQRVLVAVNTAGRYEVRPETFGPDVWLGGNAPGQRYAQGYIDNVHSANTFERGRAVSAGDWQAVPFTGANFGASAGSTWDVDAADVFVHRWTVIGQTMHFNMTILGSNVNGAGPIELAVATPSGYTVAAPFFATMFFNSGGGNLVGYATSTAGAANIRFGQLSGAAWAVASTNVFVSIAFEVTG